MENETSGGISFVGVLTLIFIVLKLVGTINWSWWWVLSPMLFSLGIGIVLILIIISLDFKK